MSIQFVIKNTFIFLLLLISFYGCIRNRTEMRSINYVEKFYNSNDKSKYYMLINLFDEDTTLFQNKKEFIRVIDFNDDKNINIYNIQENKNCILLTIKEIKADSFSYIDVVISNGGMGEVKKRESIKYKKTIFTDCSLKKMDKLISNIEVDKNFVLNTNQKYIVEYFLGKNSGMIVVKDVGNIDNEYFTYLRSIMSKYDWQNIEYIKK